MRQWVAWWLVPALAGCLADPAAVDFETMAQDTPDARPALAAPQFLEPTLLGHACCWPQMNVGAEPNVAVADDGTVFVASSGALWRSGDGGRSYTSLNQMACSAAGQATPCVFPNERHASIDSMGDADVIATPDGRVHWLGLHGESGAVPYQVSDDQGATFGAGIDRAAGTDADREWIAFRDADRLYATWREQGDLDRLVFMRSSDGGASWSAKIEMGDDRLQGPIALDPSSQRIYVPAIGFSYDGSVDILRSSDDGRSWDIVEAAPADGASRPDRDGNPTYIFPVAAVDAAGTVYLVWSNDEDGGLLEGSKDAALAAVWFTMSRDGGDTWSPKASLSAPGRHAIFPWIDAGDAGRVVVAWYEGALGLPGEALLEQWNLQLVESVDADAASPTFLGGFANAEPFHLGPICTRGGDCDLGTPAGGVRVRDRSMLDFFEVEIKPDGQPVVAWAAGGPHGRDGVRVLAGGVAAGTPLVGGSAVG